jgi:hypothetical protein
MRDAGRRVAGRRPAGRRPAGRRLRFFVALGATAGALIGSVIGLIVGLFVYAPTAPIALVEVGLPAAAAGALLGLLLGSIYLGRCRSRRQIDHRPATDPRLP